VVLLLEGSPEEFRSCATLGLVALVSSLQVVELDEGSERGLELVPASEVASSEHGLPILMKNGPLCRPPTWFEPKIPHLANRNPMVASSA